MIERRSIRVSMDSRDEIHAEWELEGGKIRRWKLHWIGCSELKREVRRINRYLSFPIGKYPVSATHANMLARELLLKMKDRWNPPVQSKVICPCFRLPTADVDTSVLLGCTDFKSAKRQTMAGAKCRLCEVDIKKLIEYRLTATV